jgi:hypothetical protein
LAAKNFEFLPYIPVQFAFVVRVCSFLLANSLSKNGDPFGNIVRVNIISNAGDGKRGNGDKSF